MNKEEIAKQVDEAISIDKQMKEDKKRLDGIKAKLQAEGQILLENQNTKQVELYGEHGSCQVGYSEKLDITNYSLLKNTIGDIVVERVKKEESVKYTPDKLLKQALIAAYKKDYKNHDIRDLLVKLGLEDKQIKVCLKKLKGDYFKDRATIESFISVLKGNNLEEEMDAIREQLNYELIDKFIDLELLDFDSYRRSMIVEETLSIGLSYEND